MRHVSNVTTAGFHRTQIGIVSAWRLYLTFTVLLLSALLLCYRDSFASMAAIWLRSDTFAHGILIMPLSAYMIWTRRHTLSRLQPRTNAWGLVLVFTLSLLWHLARAVDVVVIEQFSVLAMVPALVLTVLGARVFRAIAFPMAYLIFAVPMGEALVPVLQDITGVFVVHGVRLFGIPVYAEGRYISLPSGDWEVARACSGIRYLMASAALGSTFAYFAYRNAWRRTAFILLAFTLPIVANGLRAYGIVMLGHVSGMRIATGADHLVYGWLFFGMAMTLLFWLGSIWREQRPPFAAATDTPRVLQDFSRQRNNPIAIIGLALVILVGGRVMHDPVWGDVETATAHDRVQALQARPPWRGPYQTTDIWQPRFLGADGSVKRGYRLDEKQVILYAVYYLDERQGAELINSENTLYNPAVWRRVAENRHAVSYANGRTLTVHETIIRSADKARVIWHWYRVAGHSTNRPFVAKLLGVWGRLTGTHSSAALIAITSDFDEDAETARDTLRRFLMRSYTDIVSMLAQADIRSTDNAAKVAGGQTE